jgi:hypothetical protein
MPRTELDHLSIQDTCRRVEEAHSNLEKALNNLSQLRADLVGRVILAKTNSSYAKFQKRHLTHDGWGDWYDIHLWPDEEFSRSGVVDEVEAQGSDVWIYLSPQRGEKAALSGEYEPTRYRFLAGWWVEITVEPEPEE